MKLLAEPVSIRRCQCCGPPGKAFLCVLLVRISPVRGGLPDGPGCEPARTRGRIKEEDDRR